MADGIKEFSQTAQRAQVAAGMKGGDFYDRPATPAPLKVAECPSTVTEKFEAKETPKMDPIAPWNSRR